MKKKNSLLWKITHKQLPDTSFVFGTMHVKDQRAFSYEQLVKENINGCKVFATELNFSEIEMMTSEDVMNLPPGESLQSLMKPKLYDKVSRIFFDMTGLDIGMFDNKLPIMLTNIMTESVLSKDMPYSLDRMLWNYAQEKEKITMGIESYDEQLDILGKIPLEYQIKTLKDVCKNIRKFRQNTLKTTQLYEAGDIQKLYKFGKKSLKGIKKLLLYDRNALMAERIGKIAAEQSIFAAVGAGHLAGEKGLLKLLKNQGFKVKPVPYTRVGQLLSDC